MIRYSSLLGALVLSLASPSVRGAELPATYDPASRSMSNWRAEATQHLGVTEEALAKHQGLRCIRLNNYWCLKDVGWLGGLAHDADDHTAFKDGYFAARAAVRNFRTAYFRHGRKSAFDIMSVYAPPDDCVGSNAGRRADGSCRWGFNPTQEYARIVAAGITQDPRADLHLFQLDGSPNLPALIRFLQNMSTFETAGLTVDSKTIERGICMERDNCVQPQDPGS